MINDDFRVVYEDLPTTIGGFVREKDDFHTIILNSRMTYMRNIETFNDEMDHIESGALNSTRSADSIETESHRRRNKT